ncbi:AfsA-related hotdog domain-containing protein [Rhodococcus sp. HNM0569]|uniref:AfsA-related hotdog domain-containing protein n=1 Tax=Rhodococcus sp. HNM0569 TaxID=2716340 RepID=UPI00146DE138|nr:AfsA-related hotdog domain-containing protein [Rhodococcus sp. HNM0569]NLU82685.1 hypothetical protein [Rhodococcus sp. HNM0569]
MTATVQDLSFDRNIPRDIVHRESIAEVFLTDARRYCNGAVFAAQLPRNHSYFSDHRGTATTYDPLLLIEVFRQVAIYYAHTFVGVERAQKFVFGSADFEIVDGETFRIGSCPGHCTVTADVLAEKKRNGTVIGLTLEMTAYIEEQIAARETMVYQWMPANVWARIRHRGRQELGLPEAPQIPAPSPVARMRPGAVGRNNPRNAILANPAFQAGEISALTVIDTNHPSLFDHALDHVPGMLQFEAARQIAMAATNASLGLDTSRMVMHHLEISFGKFAEFEIATMARAVAALDPDREGGVTAEIRIMQDDATVASGRVGLQVMPVDIWTLVQ